MKHCAIEWSTLPDGSRVMGIGDYTCCCEERENV
jgi:hypothetical protein